MTLTQLKHIEDEFEKIELAVLSDNMKKIKVFGNFLTNRLNVEPGYKINLI